MIHFTRTIVLVVLFLVFPLISSAQFSLQANLALDTSPRTPEPNEEVTITASSLSFSIDFAEITWIVNGEIVEEGVGRNQITVTTGDAGEEINVVVRALPSTNVPASGSVTIIPAEVQLIWEAETNVPSFYRGRPLHTQDSEVRLIALPNLIENNQKLDAQSITYTWTVNREVRTDLSGVGRNIISISNPTVSRPLEVFVTAKSPSGVVQARNATVVPVYSPEVQIYRQDPILGTLFNKTILPYAARGEEVTLVAAPFYFSDDNRDLTFVWQRNGLDELSTTDTLLIERDTFFPQELLSVEVSGINPLAQTAREIYTILEESAQDTLFAF